MATGQERLLECKTAMLLHVPFFASLLMDMMKMHLGKFPDVFPPGNETAATDGKNIWIDEDFFAKLKLPEAVFLLCHEVGHAMWSHLSRGKQYSDLGFDGEEFDPRLWNVAGDYVINDMLVEAKIGRMPEVGLHDTDKGTQEDLVDDVYRKLRDNEKKNGKGSEGGTPDGAGMDIHILAPSKETEQEWKRATATAAEAAKAVGKLPAGLERFVEKLLNPTVPWQDKLRYHVTRAISREATTWARPNRRRLVTQGVVLPSYTGFSAGEVVVAVDTSGSIGKKELTVFLSELQSILDVSKPERVWLLGIDAEVNSVHELYSTDSLADNPPKLGGGGGTSFVPAFEWVEEEGINPAALIYFTDMYGSAPAEPPPYKVIWCATTDYDSVQWGERVPIDLSEYKE